MQHPRQLISSQGYISADIEAHAHDHHTATPSFDSRFSHTPCGLGFGCSKESRINLANSISMRCVRTAEHLAGMLTTGAFYNSFVEVFGAIV